MHVHEKDTPRMYGKRVRLSGTTYDLVVARVSETNWRWVGGVLVNNEVLKVVVPHSDHREEAMKEAYCIANMHAGIPGDYPERYWKGWRKLRLPLVEELICRQARLDRTGGHGPPKVQ